MWICSCKVCSIEQLTIPGFVDNIFSFNDCLFGKGNSNICTIVLVRLNNMYRCYIGS